MNSGYALGIVLLAAGRGSRMERPKLTLPWGRETTVVGQSLRTALAAPVRAVVAVTGAGSDAVQAALAAAAGGDGRPSLSIVHNPDWEQGMSTSLQAGVAALPPGLDGFFVALGDMPLVSAAVYQSLAAAFAEEPAIWRPAYQGRQGHPVLLPYRYVRAVASLQGDVGLRRVLAANEAAVRALPVAAAGVLVDLDTPEEYQRYAPTI